MFAQTNFFAIVEENERKTDIRRIPLSGEAQSRLCELFSRLTGRLLCGDFDKIPFDGRYKPDEGELQVIADYEVSMDIINALEEPTSLEPLSLRDETSKVKAIFTGVLSPRLLIAFQKFNQSQHLSRTGLSLFYSGDTLQLIKGPAISLPFKIDCIVNGKELLFPSFWHARQILDLSDYYREATDADIAAFIDNDFLYVADTVKFIAQADTWVRRKVALIRDSSALQLPVETVVERAAEYGVEVEVIKEKGKMRLVIPDDKKRMKQVLQFLDEDIYSGPITNRKYISNSKRSYSAT